MENGLITLARLRASNWLRKIDENLASVSAGMATQGMKVFCNIYSSFMQRAYDMVVHDVAIQKLPVIF